LRLGQFLLFMGHYSLCNAITLTKAVLKALVNVTNL